MNIIDNIDEGLVVFDSYYNVEDYNQSAKNYFPFLNKTEKSLNSNFLELVNTLKISKEKEKKVISHVFDYEDKIFTVKIKIIDNKFLCQFNSLEEAYFYKLFNAKSSHITICEPINLKVIHVNKNFLEFTGYKKEEIIGLENLNFLEVDESDKRDRELLEKAIEEREHISVTLKNKTKNGRIYFVELNMLPIINDITKEPLFFLCIQSIVTNNVEQKIYLDSILNNSKSIILRTNGEKLNSLNQRFFQIFDFKDFNDFKSKHQCICDLFIDKGEHYLMPYKDNMSWIEQLKEHKALYETLNIQKACMIDSNGKERIFQVESSGKIFEEEEFIITFTEITILMKNRELLENQTKHAAMGEMIAMIAHQWRQPLTTLNTINAKISVLREMDMLDDKTFNESMHKNATIVRHLSETIDDFKNYFHKERISEKISLSNLIEKTTRLFKSDLLNENIDFEINYNKLSNIILIIDSSKFTQVFLNLIKNAYDAILEKNPLIKFIKIDFNLINKSLEITISDSAGGIPENIINKVFEPYFSTKCKNGTGLGLYMSKIIIEDNLKGKITVTNTQEGALFTIILPKEILSDT